MPDYDDYYSHDELKETTFDGFKVTSIDPGNALLISIAGVAILYVLMSLIFLKWTKGKKITHDVDCTYLNRIYSRYNGPNNHNGTTELEIVDFNYSDVDLLSCFEKYDIKYIERVEHTYLYTSKHNDKDHERNDETFIIEIRQNQEFKNGMDNTILDCSSDILPIPDTSGKYLDGETVREIKKMLDLACPWAFGAFVENAADIIKIAVISRNIGTAEMICYSYVWFVIDACHIISKAMYESLYKHANNAAALETEEGYVQAGKYIQICCIINSLLSFLISTCLVFTMGPILRIFGYGNKIVELSDSYIIIAVVTNLITISNSYLEIVPDLGGHADFDALYGLFESTTDIAVSIFIVPYLKPTLAGLGVILLTQDIISYMIYYAITVGYKGYFDGYKRGILCTLDLRGDDRKMLISFLKTTIPLTFDEICDELKGFVLTLFSTHLGVAEAVTWILINHIWEFVGILSEHTASALEYRCAHLLSIGKIQVSQKMASASICIAFSFSALCCALLYLLKNVIVHGIIGDKTIQGMLLEIIPFIVLFDPLISISITTEYLNRALALYGSATKIQIAMTILVTFPAAYISTYEFNYNIKGIVAASYLGLFSIGFCSNMVFMKADWERAVEKNKEMTGLDSESESDSESSESDSESEEECECDIENGSKY